MRIGLQIVGGPELAASLRGMEAAASRKIVVGALRRAGGLMADRMASYMPRSDEAPHVADSVVVTELKVLQGEDGRYRSVLPDEYVVGVGPAKDFFYWFFKEYGTVYQPAVPAMRPGFDQTVEQCLGILIAVLRQSIAATAAAGGRAAPGAQTFDAAAMARQAFFPD